MLKQLSTLGQVKLKNPESTELTEYVESLSVSEIISTIVENLHNPEGPQALHYVLLGFTEKNVSQNKRLKLCQAIIKEIQSSHISNRSAVAIASCIAQELNKFPTTHLVAIAEECVDFIRSVSSDGQTSWKDLLPKVLCESESRQEVEYAGTEFSGEKFKQRLIQDVCSIQWNPAIVTSLAAMFIDIQLDEEEHRQVVNKLCKYFEKIPPQEIPPLVHQLLILCKHQHGVTVFLSLQKYFNSTLYKKKDAAVDVDSISTELNVESKELSDCEDMVLYHIEESAKLSRGCVMDLIKFTKASVNIPEIILNPFLLAVLLSISTISAYETQLIEILKAAILRSAQEEERCQESAWLRLMAPSHVDFKNVLILLLQSKVSMRDKVLKGLVNFCSCLLNMQATKGKEAAVGVLWSYSRHSLVYVVKCHRQVSTTVLKTLTDNIITGQNVMQYADCLVKLSNAAPLVMIDNMSILLRLLDFLGQLPPAIARRVITAVLSLVCISNKLRDSFILILRKALFSRDIETRKIAVTGFLQLLKVLKVKGLAALSQSEQSFSGPSVFSQICMEVHTQGSSASSSSSNEAICLEVIGVLRRCFIQQAPVKMCLYQGLYNALCRNPELCSSVLDTMIDHFNQFYLNDNATLPPLDVGKAIIIQEAAIILQEPVGELVFVMQQVALKALDEYGEDDQPRSLEKLRTILDSMVSRYSQCDLMHFDLDEGTNFLDILPETLKMQEVVRQTIGVYQALMAYTVCSWTPACDLQQGQKLLSLFKAQNLLIEYVKNCKPSKKEPGGGKKENKNAGLKKAPVFQLPETVLDLYSVNRMLTLLLSEDVPWATDESTLNVKGHRSLLRYATQAALEVVQLIKAKSTVTSLLKPISELTKLLYERVLRRFNEVAQFERSAAVCAIECLDQLLSLIFTNFRQISPIICELVGVDKDKDLPQQLKPLIKAFQQLLVDSVSEDDDEIDATDKQLLHTVISALSLLALRLPSEHAYTLKILDWLVDFAHKRTLPTVPHAKSYMTLLLTMTIKCKAEASLLDSLAVQLTHLFGSINEVEIEESPLSLSLVSQSTKVVVLPLLCNTIHTCLDQVDWLLGRLRAVIATKAFPTVTGATSRSYKEVIQKHEKNVVHQLGHCVNVMQSICCVAVPTGACTEALFRLLSRSYTILIALTKYFISKCSPQDLDYQHARFGKLVKLAGSHLSSQVADLILYVEDLFKIDKEKKVKEVQLLSQARKQAVYIPRLVADLENFSKTVTILSKKCKDDSLSTSIKLTTTRDFRINTKKLQEVMRRTHENEDAEGDEDVNMSRAQMTQSSSSVIRGKENMSQTMSSQRTTVSTSQPAAKRLRLK